MTADPTPKEPGTSGSGTTPEQPHEHHWRFDGDDPRLVCKCGEYRDALTGEPIEAQARPEQDEAVRLTGEALYRTYWHAAVANSQDWPTQWERLSHPTRAVWDSFAAALATPATPAALDVERLTRVLSDHFGPSYFPGMTDVTIHGKSPGAIAEQIAAEYARLSPDQFMDIDRLQQDGAQE